MAARSMLSGDGFHSSSPRRSAAVSVSPIAALISPRRAPADVAVERAHQLEDEVMRAFERLAVDAPRYVVRAVVAGGEDGAVGQAGDGGGAELRNTRREGVGAEAASPGPRVEAVAVVAVGVGNGGAELGEVVRHGEALARLVADGAGPHRVEDDEVARLAVEALAVRADEGAHPLH